MTNLGGEVLLPFTRTARNYGYITWRKKADAVVRGTLGERRAVDLEIEGSLQARKRIDWKKRRIAITWTVTRGVSPKATRICLRRISDVRVLVRFV
jgi:hypothetical protein